MEDTVLDSNIENRNCYTVVWDTYALQIFKGHCIICLPSLFIEILHIYQKSFSYGHSKKIKNVIILMHYSFLLI